MNISRALLETDRKLFYFINTKLATAGLDNLMLLTRQAFTWIPLYLFFLVFFISNCRKFLIPIIALTLVTFTFTDFTSASILKPLIGRLRPCHDPSLPFSVNNISGCGGIFSMPSSHAANHFGLATFWYNVIKQTVNRKWNWLWLWAAFICFSQVYVGVHYPADVFIGALLGMAIAAFTSHLFNSWINKIDNNLSVEM